MEPDSPAAKAGLQDNDLVTDIDKEPITSWRDIDGILADSDGKPLHLYVKRQGEIIEKTVKPEKVNAKNLFGDDISYYDIGISGFAELQAIVEEVMNGMPAQKAGLEKGDQIVAIDGQPIDSWQRMQEIVSQSKGKTLTFRVRRGDQTFETQIKPEMVQDKNILGVKYNAYRIGIRAPDMSVPKQDQMTIRLNPVQAVNQGLIHTWDLAKVTVYFFGKLFQGKVPMESIGGPIRIAQMARKEADQGLVSLLNFIAIISVNLAILNLLPIPVLDGGHILFFGIEAVIRRPVNTRTRETAQQIGIFLLLLLMIFVFYNDITLTWFK